MKKNRASLKVPEMFVETSLRDELYKSHFMRHLEDIEVVCGLHQNHMLNGVIVQLVRTLACHARGRGFESHWRRQVLLLQERYIE